MKRTDIGDHVDYLSSWNSAGQIVTDIWTSSPDCRTTAKCKVGGVSHRRAFGHVVRAVPAEGKPSRYGPHLLPNGVVAADSRGTPAGACSSQGDSSR